jgi:hypothetical protein
MKKTVINSIALGIVVSAMSTFAAEDAASQENILKRLDALEGANKSSSWAEKVQIKGDVRYRYELRKNDQDGDENLSRHRIRARVGAYAKVNDNVKAGFRVASGSSDSPTSTNQTIGDEFSEKPVWIDLAYIILSCEQVEGLSATFGKMKQPWVQVSDLIFDSDVNPEGINFAYDTKLDGISVMSRFGYHIVDEDKWEDHNLVSGQIAASAKVEEDIKLTAGVGAFVYDNLPGTDYDIIDGFAKLDINKGPAPIKLYGEYLQNIADDVSGDCAWIFGIGAKCPKSGVSLEYNYRDLGEGSVNGDLDDSDFGGPGGRGHKVKAKYALMKNTTVGATYFLVEDFGGTSGDDVNLLQLDLAVKF